MSARDSGVNPSCFALRNRACVYIAQGDAPPAALQEETELQRLINRRVNLQAELKDLTKRIRNMQRKRKRLLDRASLCTVDELVHAAAVKMRS